MSQSPVVCPKQPLPRDLDVFITISRPQTELATDMTLLVFLTDTAPFPPNNGRVRYYSSLDAISNDFASNTEGYLAGRAFFNRQVRPAQMAIGQVFETPIEAGLLAGLIDITALVPVTDGAFAITIDGSAHEITGMDFALATTLTEVADVVNTALGVNGSASVEYGSLLIKSPTTGASSTIDYASTPASGTDVSSLLFLASAEEGAQLWQGYVPGTLADEANLVGIASKCNSLPIYGWTLDKKWRDTASQEIMADWAEARTPAYLSLCTNSVTAYNTADTTNIGYYAQDKGYLRTSVIYHDNSQIYPDVSYQARALAVNYSLPNSTITMKFKQLDGMEPSVITETQLIALNSRNINCYVAIGNNSRTVREGVQSADTWFTDSLVNVDNYREELQTEVFNVFLRNNKVPYTASGQNKLISAASRINEKYTNNGTFAPRDIPDTTAESGFITAPATSIIPTPVAFATTSERAARIAPPILIVAYESGAFHKVSINVDLFN